MPGLSEPARTTSLAGLSDVAMPESAIDLHPARRSSAPLMELVVSKAMMDGVYAANRGNLEAVLAQTRTVSCLIEDLRTLALADAGRLGFHKTELKPADTLRGGETRIGFKPRKQESPSLWRTGPTLTQSRPTWSD